MEIGTREVVYLPESSSTCVMMDHESLHYETFKLYTQAECTDDVESSEDKSDLLELIAPVSVVQLQDETNFSRHFPAATKEENFEPSDVRRNTNDEVIHDLESSSNDVQVNSPVISHENEEYLLPDPPPAVSDASETECLHFEENSTPIEVDRYPRVLMKRLPADPQNLFVCGRCDSIFSCRSDLVLHAKIHEVISTPYSCALCERIFRFKTDLVPHMREHGFGVNRSPTAETANSESVVMCAECSKTFASKSVLIRHLKSHDKCQINNHDVEPVLENLLSRLDKPKRIKRVSAALQKTSASSSSSSKGNPYQIRSTGNSFSCAHCNANFNFKTDLIIHLMSHEVKSDLLRNEKKFVCPVCGKNVHKRKRGLREHVATHTGDKFYQCDECSYTARNQYSVRIHRLVHHENEKPHKCDQCDSSFYDRPKLQGHIRRQHTGVTPYQCQQCPKAYHTRSSLREHERMKHSLKEAFKCEHCSAPFRNKVVMKRHINSVHLRLVLVKCSLCPKVFCTKLGLEHHVRKIHYEEKHFSCDLCEGEFYSKGLLVKHMARHGFDSRTPARCQICNKNFVDEKCLQVHTRNHHRMKENICEKCGAAFARKDYLQKHMTSHTGERPFLCSWCGAKFSRKDNMKKHEQTMHVRAKSCAGQRSKPRPAL